MRTNNLEEMQKKVSALRKQSKGRTVIDFRKGVEYTDLYVLLDKGKKADIEPEKLLKIAADTILSLNENLDLESLIYSTGQLCKFYLPLDQHMDLLNEVCSKSYSDGPQDLIPNSVARYVFPNSDALDTTDKIRYIIKRRKKDGESQHAKMRSYFHALLDSQSKNWYSISKTDFITVGFEHTDVEKYFSSIYTSLSRKRQSKCSFPLAKDLVTS